MSVYATKPELRCTACGRRLNPDHCVVGRDKASLGGAGYSEALRAWQGVWTCEDLNIFLSGPMVTTPGVIMETPGVEDEAERVNVIAYLRSLKPSRHFTLKRGEFRHGTADYSEPQIDRHSQILPVPTERF